MLKKIRTTLAVIFFSCITLLFLDFTGTIHLWFGWMAKIQFLPALLALNAVVIIILIALTLIFGRVYCSVICPLGVFQDGVAHVHSRMKRNRYRYSEALSWLRYAMLAVMTLSVTAGLLYLLPGTSVITGILEPYSAYGRIATNILQPIYMLANNILATIAEHADSYAFYTVDVWLRGLPSLLVAVVTLTIVTVLAWRGGRIYCNTVCPVGTLLGMLARFSWFKIHIDTDVCNGCGLCSRNCKASCIDSKNHQIDYSRCVTCGDCIDKCHTGALSYSHAKGGSTANGNGKHSPDGDTKYGDNTPADSGRRSFLLATAMAATAALAQEKKKVDGGLAVIEDKVAPGRLTPITPPGSLSARNLAARCTSCQLCISECPNGVLRPSSALTTFMQPVMSYERGYCRPECTRCSEVCPAGAILPISAADKSATQIGHAVWISKNCVPLTDGVKCGNCARHCPSGAITMVPSVDGDDRSPRIPVVNEARCIGCGACENLCPARPFSAIYVEGHEHHRNI
ncbi:MAG: 4Fe-4S binding protein [Prevotella sp.]|nr:4Fe-4S binding protein [Prevotella sp.]